MPTCYERAEHDFTECILADPDGVVAYSDILRKLQSGYYAQSWVDVIFQKWAKFSKINIADAFAFAQIWSALCNGAIAYTTLLVGTLPVNDQDIEGNNSALQGALRRLNGWQDASLQKTRDACRWDGRFRGGTQDADGYIQWAGRAILGFNRDAQLAGHWISDNGRASLEVGYTHAVKTLLQLRTERKLARWPYGSDRITLLEVIAPSYPTLTVTS